MPKTIAFLVINPPSFKYFLKQKTGCDKFKMFFRVLWRYVRFTAPIVLYVRWKRKIEIKNKVIWLIIHKQSTEQIQPWGIKMLSVDATVIWPSYNKCKSHIYTAPFHSKGHLIRLSF